MNITGSFNTFKYDKYQNGAFDCQSGWGNQGMPLSGGTGEHTYFGLVNFNASRSWEGATSEEGQSQPFNNMQPYLSVYIWLRKA